jgi:murein DD-endopeptidase MepM/ murein hydrolase activator NlpD
MREVRFIILSVAMPLLLTASACGAETVPASTITVGAGVPSRTATPVPVPSPAIVATASPPPGHAALPTGFPLDPDQRTDLATGVVGSRRVESGAGPSVEDASVAQTSDDPVRANAAGWNCRVHVEYEATPAVDWYVPEGTPVFATMDGDATLIVNTVANAFDYYGVDREPFIGDPDRASAALNPFPGPGGGMGVYVAVTGEEYRTDYGHLAIGPTLGVVPEAAFADPYSRSFDYASLFATPQPYTSGVQVALWRVQKGDIIGYTGDAGYSEAPHLHYTITRHSSGERLCPTSEQGFADGGWLTR